MCYTLDELNLEIRTCRKCKSMTLGQKRVLGVGNANPLVFFLGEAPGRFGADQTGVPFTRDRSGRLFRDLIASVHLSHVNDVYISNMVKCNPRDEQGRNRRPSREEITCCRKYLQAELKLIRAKVLVPLGTLASWEVLGFRRPMQEINAKEHHNEDYGLVFPLYHPGYILRGNYSINCYREDFKRLKNLALS